MMNQVNYFELSMDEIIFENRNKEYGAYQLRKRNARNTATGFLFVLLIVSTFSVYSITKKNPVKKIEKTIIRTISLDNINIPQIIEVSAPRIVTPTVNQETIKHVELQVVQNEKPITSITPIKNELTYNPISTQTMKGPKGPLNPIIKASSTTSTISTSSATKSENKNDFVLVAEQMPTFSNMENYLRKTIHYPKQAVDIGVEGPVYIEFIVNLGGSISEAKVLRGIGFGCDEEALTAIQEMPKWKPGLQQGKPVRIKLTIPVQFKLAKN